MNTLRVKTQKGGQEFALDQSLRLASGTEGTIYRVPGDDSLVIKIYQSKVEDQHVSKLKAMLANPPDDPMRDKNHASIAWPTDLVVRPDNQEVRGFVMPRLPDPHPISRFYDLSARRTHLPYFTYQSLCQLGSNLASAVWALHDKGYVIGDVNENNIMADDSALVTIVDTDSFQIRESATGIVYRCTVYTPFYTPLELQDARFDQIDREPEHDHFGIGVLLFQLLMEGQLPFVCAFSDTNNGPVESLECLKRGYFPYAQSRSGISTPPGAPPYAMLHPALKNLFNRCFVDGYKNPAMRPTAKEWHHALRDTATELTKCSANTQHYYFNHFQNCPWCERARRFNAGNKRGNWDPFPQPGRTSAPSGAAGGRAGTQRPISPPPVRPATPPRAQPQAVFTASATSIAPGQPVTLHWMVPNAQTVQLKGNWGRVLSTSNSPNGSATVWPTKTRTYQLTAAGVSVVMPAPITISVTQPVPVTLKDITVELNKQLDLHETQIALSRTLRLKQPATPLVSVLRLKDHAQLKGYRTLNNVTIELMYAAPAS